MSYFFLSKGKLCKYCISVYVRCEGKIKSFSTSYIYNFFFKKIIFKNPSLRKRFQYFVCVLNNGVNESFKTQQFFFRIFQLGHPIHSECELNSTHQNRTIYMKKSHGKHKWNYFLKYLLRMSNSSSPNFSIVFLHFVYRKIMRILRRKRRD